MIRVQHLYAYEKKTTLLHDVSFCLSDTGFVSFYADQKLSNRRMALYLGAQRCPKQGELWFDHILSIPQTKVLGAIRATFVQGLYRDLQLIENQSVLDNITMGIQNDRGKIDRYLKEWDLERYKYTLIEDLEFIDQAKAVIIRCLLANTSMLVFDATSTVFSQEEKLQLYALLKQCSSRLLVVICGDRQANNYATHVIECEDGYIVSDTAIAVHDQRAKTLHSFYLPSEKKKAIYKDINQRSKWKYRILFLCLLISAMAINIVLFNQQLDLVELEESVLTSAGQSAIEIERQAVGDDGTLYQNRYEQMHEDDIKTLEKQFQNHLLYSYQAENTEEELTRLYGNDVYDKDLFTYSVLELENEKEMNFQYIIGRYPETYFEVCLSSETAHSLIFREFWSDIPEDASLEDILGKEIVWYGRHLTITGILPYENNANLSIEIKQLNGNEIDTSQLYRDHFYVLKGFMDHQDLAKQLTFPNVNKQLTYESYQTMIDQVQVAPSQLTYYDGSTFLTGDQLLDGEAYLDFSAVYQLMYKNRYHDVVVNDDMTLYEKLADYYTNASTLIGKQVRLKAYRITDAIDNSMLMDKTVTIKGIMPVSELVFDESYHVVEQGSIWMSEQALQPYLKANTMIESVFYQNTDANQMRAALTYLNDQNEYHAVVSNSRSFQVFVVDVKQLRTVLLFIGITFFALYAVGFVYLLQRSVKTHKNEMSVLYLFGKRKGELEWLYIKNAMFNLLKYNLFAAMASLIGIYLLITFIYYDFAGDTQIPIFSYIMVPMLCMLISWCILSFFNFLFLKMTSVVDEYFKRH